MEWKNKKLHELYDRTDVTREFVTVHHAEGYTIRCRADCFGETEEEDEDLLVELEHGGEMILVEADIILIEDK